ncbi:MAG: hypothetical protein WCK35_03145 [Chloroflexota bacterium]
MVSISATTNLTETSLAITPTKNLSTVDVNRLSNQSRFSALGAPIAKVPSLYSTRQVVETRVSNVLRDISIARYATAASQACSGEYRVIPSIDNPHAISEFGYLEPDINCPVVCCTLLKNRCS